MSSLPWCIIGDFNDLLSQQDKAGIHPHPNWLCMGFREAVDDCALSDIKCNIPDCLQDCRLTPQTNTSLFSMLFPHSHAYRETSR
jgi:hypothetical protein